jgi:hypothetical protein
MERLLSDKMRAIDQDLNVIRNKGRQHFLENQPGNFSRIIHDYSEERKGFIIWRDMLEERLVRFVIFQGRMNFMQQFLFLYNRITD